MRGATLLLLIFFLSCCIPSSVERQYGDVVTFGMGREILYPDFSVRFIGERQEASEGSSLDFIYYDFEFSTEDENLEVSWSSGTGDIAPLLFEIAGKEYFLVLKANDLESEDYLLHDNEMSVWPKDVYLRKLGLEVESAAIPKSVHKGRSTTSFETSVFTPCDSGTPTENADDRRKVDVEYWLTSMPDSGFNELLKTFESHREPTGQLSVYVKFVGTVSPTKENGYGHLNMYSDQITVGEVLNIKPWTELSCTLN